MSFSDSDSEYHSGSDSDFDTGAAAAAPAGDKDFLGKERNYYWIDPFLSCSFFFRDLHMKVLDEDNLDEESNNVPCLIYIYIYMTPTAGNESLDGFDSTAKNLPPEQQHKYAAGKLKKTFEEKGFEKAKEKFNLFK